MPERQYVRIDRDQEIAIVTIDRRRKLNALNQQVMTEIGDAFASLGEDDGVRGVILTGAGEKAFVAGADIGVLAEMTPLSAVEVSRRGQDVLAAIERFPKPVMAAVGGFALGGGCELAMACHLRIASANARFGLPEVTLGIVPGYGGTIRLARIVGLGRALEMTLTGDMIDAATAERYGLVSRVVERAELHGAAVALMRRITKNAPVALRFALESIYAALDSAETDAHAFESSLFGVLAATEDMREGMGAFLERRGANFRGR
jgi:enoyl-CoA hydratase